MNVQVFIKPYVIQMTVTKEFYASLLMVPTWTGKTGRHFPDRGELRNFNKTGKVWEFIQSTGKWEI